MFLVAALGGWWVVRQTFAYFRGQRVSSGVLTRPWVTSRIGQSDVQLDAPWPLQGLGVPFPKELSGKVSQWTWIGHEGDGLYVAAARVVYAHNIPTSLEGAADGMVSNIEAMKVTRSVIPKRTNTKLLGHRAIELEVRIVPEKGEPLLMHGIVVLRGQELTQVLSIGQADQPLADQAWVRVRDSVRKVQSP